MEYDIYTSTPNKTVVAVIDNVDRLVIQQVIKQLELPVNMYDVWNALQKMELPKTLRGKATCNLSDDEYSEETGIKIAVYRLRQKYNKLLARVYREIASNELKIAKKSIALMQKYSTSVDEVDRYTHY